MKIKTVLFLSAMISVLFAALAINLFSNWTAPRIYAQDSTQQQQTVMLRSISISR